VAKTRFERGSLEEHAQVLKTACVDAIYAEALLQVA
jgi:hypothetical protein